MAGRRPLYEVLPLDAPFVLTISPAEVCNFRCNYCFNYSYSSTPIEKAVMSWEFFSEVLEQAQELSPSYRRINLTGFGEPLMNKDISRMLQKIYDMRLTDFVEITTNAVFLTPKLTHELVDAGLSRLVISAQGVNAEQYQKTCGVKVGFDALLQNIAYFYQNKKQCQVMVKTVDTALNGEKDAFYELFSPISDIVNIEEAIPIYKHADASIFAGRDFSKTRYGFETVDKWCCSDMFYRLWVLANGDTSFCCAVPFPWTENCKTKRVKDIWHGAEHLKVIKLHLEKKRKEVAQCKECLLPSLLWDIPADNLDGHLDELLQKYKKVF